MARKTRPTEHSQQRLLFQWAKLQEKRYPELALMFAIPNQRKWSWAVWNYFKAEGFKSGVPDVFLPARRLIGMLRCGGLFIEMKRDAKEKTSKEQDSWIEDLQMQGYRVEVGYGFEDARDKILAYLNGDQEKPSER